MSFGVSVGIFASYINFLSQALKQLEEGQQSYRESRQVVVILDALDEKCKTVTDLDVVFIADYNVRTKKALETPAEADRLLRSTGLASTSRNRSSLEAIETSHPRSYSKHDARNLWNDLRQKAQHFRLILVCDVEKYRVLWEAVREDKWLQGRIFGITTFETHQHPGHRCQQNGFVCCSEEGPDLVLWSIIRLIEDSKKQAFAKDFGKLELPCRVPSSGALSALNSSLRTEKLGRAQATIRALQCVAFAVRPLHIDELLEALATEPASIFGSPDLTGDGSSVHGQQGLIELVSGVLEVRDNGLVFFKDSDVRHRFLKIVPPEWKTLQNGHEVLATICLQHLQCLGHENVLKPWASISRWLVDKSGECRLHSYATAFWHEHCRLAENQSWHLPALLHQTISSAISMHNIDSEEHILALKDKTNCGLWISATYGLRTLCKTYLEMGADLNLTNTWHKHPLQMLTPPFRKQHLELSLGFGIGLAMVADELQVPGCWARSGASISSMNGVIELQKASDACPQADRGVSGNFRHSCFSPLQMATVYGHLAILKLFREDPSIALPGLKNDGIHYAAKSHPSEIRRNRSPVSSYAGEIEQNLKDKRSLYADYFSDVTRSFHSFSLAETQALNGFYPSMEADTTGPTNSEDLPANCIPLEDGEWLVVAREEVEWG